MDLFWRLLDWSLYVARCELSPVVQEFAVAQQRFPG